MVKTVSGSGNQALAAYKLKVAQEEVSTTNLSSLDIQRKQLTKLWITGFSTASKAPRRLQQIQKLVADAAGIGDLGLVIERSRFDYSLVSCKLEDAKETLAVVKSVINDKAKEQHITLHARWTHIVIDSHCAFNDRLRQVTSHYADLPAFQAMMRNLHKQYGIIKGAEFYMPTTFGPAFAAICLAKIEDVDLVVGSTIWCDHAKKNYSFKGPSLALGKRIIEQPHSPYDLLIEDSKDIQQSELDDIVKMLVGTVLLSRKSEHDWIVTPTSFAEATTLREQWRRKCPRNPSRGCIVSFPQFLVEYNSQHMERSKQIYDSTDMQDTKSLEIALTARLGSMEKTLHAALQDLRINVTSSLQGVETSVTRLSNAITAIIGDPTLDTSEAALLHPGEADVETLEKDALPILADGKQSASRPQSRGNDQVLEHNSDEFKMSRASSVVSDPILDLDISRVSSNAAHIASSGLRDQFNLGQLSMLQTIQGSLMKLAFEQNAASSDQLEANKLK